VVAHARALQHLLTEAAENSVALLLTVPSAARPSEREHGAAEQLL